LDCLWWLCVARLIIGGGGMADDGSRWFPVVWSSLFVLINRMFGNQPIFFCIGVDDISRRVTKTLVGKCYSLARTIITRDANSAKVLISLGVPNCQVRIARDVVFSLERETLPAFMPEKGGRPHVVLVVRHDNDRTPGKPNFFAAIVEQFVSAGCTVCITVHDRRMEYDLGVLLQLEEKYRGTAHVMVFKPTCLHDVLELYALADAVVSSRYHPIVLASILGSMPIAIADSLTRKLGVLVEDLRVPVLSNTESNPQAVDEIWSILQKREAYQAAISAKVREFKLAVEDAVCDALQENCSLSTTAPKATA
jgi:polysaccharide pyruvyl transferase WcaK-like protein